MRVWASSFCAKAISRFPGLEILATVVVKLTASPHGVFVGDFVRLWPSHSIRPFTLAALEGINFRSVNLAVRNDRSRPWHGTSLPRTHQGCNVASRSGYIANSARQISLRVRKGAVVWLRTRRHLAVNQTRMPKAQTSVGPAVNSNARKCQ